MPVVKNIEFSFKDVKIETCPKVDVKLVNYDNVLKAIQELHPEYRDIRIISFKK